MNVNKKQEYKLLAEQLKVRLTCNERVKVNEYGINITPTKHRAILSMEKLALFAEYNKLYCIIDVNEENNLPRVIMYK